MKHIYWDGLKSTHSCTPVIKKTYTGNWKTRFLGFPSLTSYQKWNQNQDKFQTSEIQVCTNTFPRLWNSSGAAFGVLMTAVQRNDKNVASESPYACRTVQSETVHIEKPSSFRPVCQLTLSVLNKVNPAASLCEAAHVSEQANKIWQCEGYSGLQPNKMWQSKLFAVFGKISVCIWDRGRPKVDWWQFSAIARQLAAQWPRHSVSSECLCKPQIPPRLTSVPMWHIMLLTFSSRGGEHGGAWQAKKGLQTADHSLTPYGDFPAVFVATEARFFFFFFFFTADHLKQFLWQQNQVFFGKPGDISSHLSGHKSGIR